MCMQSYTPIQERQGANSKVTQFTYFQKSWLNQCYNKPDEIVYANDQEHGRRTTWQ